MLPDGLRRLVQLFSRLPGVGEKTAQRYTLQLLGQPEIAALLGHELSQLPERFEGCSRCGNVAEKVPGEATVCGICRDSRRDDQLLCIVARIQDLMAVERSGAMRGRYFVLGRLLSPLEGIGPEELPLGRLEERIREDGVKEVILATPPSVDGEATALLLAQELSKHGLSVSRIASGVPHGGDLEFADQVTLGRAIDGRRGIDIPR